MVNTIIVTLYLLSFLLIWQFVGYPLLMAVVALRQKPKNKDYSFQPFVSIVVPTYNEEKVIKKRIENLVELDYPKDMAMKSYISIGKINTSRCEQKR